MKHDPFSSFSPIWACTGDGAEVLASSCRNAFNERGFVMIPDFVTRQHAGAMAAEASALEDQAYFTEAAHNLFLETPLSSPSNGSNGVQCGASEVATGGGPSGFTSVGSIATDRMDPSGPLLSLYSSQPFVDFLSMVVFGEAGKLHRLADPLGACTVNVYREGDQHFWHFDESPFSVTLSLQAPNAGGVFNAVANTRVSKHVNTSAFLLNMPPAVPCLVWAQCTLQRSRHRPPVRL